MKPRTALAIFCFFIAITFFACKKDSLPDAPNAPSLELINDTIISTFGADFFLEAQLADEVGLKSFSLKYDEWYLSNTISLDDSTYPKSYNMRYKFKMPASAANKTHRLTLTATNIGGKETSKEFVVMINVDFPKLFLVESDDPSKLTSDLFGSPILIEKTGTNQFKALYYSAAANSKIWFAPGKTALSPTLYGVDPDNTSKLTGDASRTAPIVLPLKGYYSITLNTSTLDYNVEELSAPDPGDAFAEVALAGQGFYDYPNIMWQNALPDIILMDKDPDNPYLFTKIVRLGTPPGQTYGEASFIFTTNNGWTDFWRFDNAKQPEFTVPNGGETGGGFAISSTPVSYKITFDTYTNRCKFELQ